MTTPTTTKPITTDGWYEHADGTYGYYASQSPGMPRLRIGPCRDYECVHRDGRGSILRLGWPAIAPLRAHFGLDTPDALNSIPLSVIATAIVEIKQLGAALATIEQRS